MTRPTGVGLFNYDPPGTGFGGIDARAVRPDFLADCASLRLGSSLLNNAFFCVLAYVLGVGSRWFWGPVS